MFKLRYSFSYLIGSIFLLSAVDADLCPETTILAPFCSCYQFQEDGLPDLLCENIETVDQLVQIFNRSFPSNSLKSLTIEYSNLPELPANAFSDKTFERISIERSKIKSIDRHAFAGSKDVLQALMVASNDEMSKFPLDGLWGFEKLATIILSDLKIDSIRTLPSLPSLKKLAIQELRNLKVLSPLPYLPNLKNLRFVNTGIQKIENNCFEGLPALEKFDFDGNDLKVIKKGNFQFYSHVTELSFEENGIIEVEEGAFGGINDAVIVSLAQNNILALKESSFKPVLQAVAKNSGKVILLGNRLECFCDMKWLIDNAELSEALFEAKCAGKTDLTTLTKGYLDQVC